MSFDSNNVTIFTNCRVCRGGRLIEGEYIAVSNETGLIVDCVSAPTSENTIDLAGAIVAPGLIELQTNGMRGFHFTHFSDEESYSQKLFEVASYLPSTGCTAFYATIPTVSSDDFKKVDLIKNTCNTATKRTPVDSSISRASNDRRFGHSTWCACRRPLSAPYQERRTQLVSLP